MINFPQTRDAALQRLDQFLDGEVVDYARRRGAVTRGHPHVSRLSPALSVGLLQGEEVIQKTLLSHPLEVVEKFVQEVCWRLYWRAWLEDRPEVWSRYNEALAAGFPDAVVERASLVASAGGGVAIMDYFARELVDTGYLHNHARMWFASYWVHVEKLPWELGAQFFFDHLMDADAASNTLSWRWVAGLHTVGKTYLVRRGNLERWIDPAVLADHQKAFDRLPGSDAADPPPIHEPEPVVRVERETAAAPAILPMGRIGLIVHDGILAPDIELRRAGIAPDSILVVDPAAEGTAKSRFRGAARGDSAGRLGSQFGCQVDLGTDIGRWIAERGVRNVITVRPPVGELSGILEGIPDHIPRSLIPSGGWELPAATGGFFSFWKKLRTRIANADREGFEHSKSPS